MADEAAATQSREKSPNQVLWLALAALTCLVVMALAGFSIAYLLGRSQPSIHVSPVINSNNTLPAAPASTAAPAVPTPMGRPHNPGVPQGSRMTEPMAGAPGPMPGKVGSPQKGVREGAPIRADMQTPPYASGLTPATRTGMFMRMRPRIDSPQGMAGAVPFRIRQFKVGADGRVDGVAAGYPGIGQEAEFSYLPDQAYRPAASKSLKLSLELLNPRKTSQIDGLRAPKNFQFFVTELRLTNVSDGEVKIEPDIFEVRDKDKVAYLANPELMTQGFASALAPGAQSGFLAAYLVPADAQLDSLVTLEPGGGILTAPLQAP